MPIIKIARIIQRISNQYKGRNYIRENDVNQDDKLVSG